MLSLSLPCSGCCPLPSPVLDVVPFPVPFWRLPPSLLCSGCCPFLCLFWMFSPFPALFRMLFLSKQIWLQRYGQGRGHGSQCLKVSWVAPLKGTLWEASRDPRHLHAGSMYAAPQGRIHACVSPSQASVWDIYIYIYISEPHTPFRWILIVMGTSPIYTGYTGYTRYSRYPVFLTVSTHFGSTAVWPLL